MSLMNVKIFTNKKDIILLKESILGIIEYGKKTDREDRDSLNISDALPYQFIEVENLEQKYFEVWCVNEPIEYIKKKHCTMSISNNYCFQSVTIKESGRIHIDAQKAYEELFTSLNMNSYCIIRFWNYISNINSIGYSEEKYKEFCRGREDAFSRYYPRKIRAYPAATGIGCKGEHLCITLLAVNKKMTVKNIENPRQVPAYQYPNRYGLFTPKFSRATYIKNEMTDCILISGTASIIGADTVFVDDIEMQTITTIDNIFALLSSENLKQYGISINQNLKLIKVYIKNWDDYSTVRGICEKKFGQVDILYLQNDICRKDLLVEIEALILNIQTK